MIQITTEETSIFTAENAGTIKIIFGNTGNIRQSVKKNSEYIEENRAYGDRTIFVQVDPGDQIYVSAETEGSECEIILE